MKRYYIGAVLLVLIGVAAAVGNYYATRGKALDERKVSDLRTLDTAINDYASANHMPPSELKQLKLEGGITKRLGDYEYNLTPLTQKDLVFSQTNAQYQFQLCTSFATDTVQGTRYPSPNDTYFEPSEHGKGRQCFKDTVSADISPNYNNGIEPGRAIVD